MTQLSERLAQLKSENRAAFIAYLPAGFPTVEKSKAAIEVLVKNGVDIVEIGFPYSDPIMDGPIIQEAADIALANGTGASEVLEILGFTTNLKVPAVVMTYWNPIEQYGISKFADAIKSANGSGVITPDLSLEEANPWIRESDRAGINNIFVAAPSSAPERLSQVASACSGFVYAASLMGVTGTRTSVSSSARDLVSRIRESVQTPVCVGLGVSTPEQAKEVASYADGVIVGSALIKVLLENSDFEKGLEELATLTKSLAEGIRQAR
jgi:tryptophan synthase alpha chain